MIVLCLLCMIFVVLQFPGAIRLRAAEGETGPGVQLAPSSGLSESYDSYTIVRMSINPAARSGSEFAEGTLFYLGPILTVSCSGVGCF